MHKNSLSEKLKGINFDYQLHFEKHFKDICQKASREVNYTQKDWNHIWV